MEKYTYSPGVDAPPTGAIAKLTVGTILKAMYLRKAFEKKKKEPYFCGDLGFCVFLCMGLVFVFGDFPTFCFFRWKSSGGFLQLGHLAWCPGESEVWLGGGVRQDHRWGHRGGGARDSAAEKDVSQKGVRDEVLGCPRKLVNG